MSDSHTFRFSSACAFVVTTSLAIAYWVDLSDATPNGCQGPSYFWAKFSKWYLLLSAILLGVILLLNSAWRHDYSKLKKTIIWLLFLPNLGTIIWVIGAFIGFSYRSQCPDLHDLLVVSFWVAILVCLSPFLTCLLLCLSGGVEAVKRLFGHHHHHEASYRHVTDVERGNIGY